MWRPQKGPRLLPIERHTRAPSESEWIASSRLHLVFRNHITQPTDRPDQSWFLRVIDLGPQMANVYVHDIGRPVETLIPHMFQNHCARKDAASVGHQIFKNAVFFGGQLDSFPAFLHLLREAVE